jgi:hypothetical protein
MFQDVPNLLPKIIARFEIPVSDLKAAPALEIVTTDIRKTKLLVGEFIPKPIVEAETPFDHDRLLLGRGFLPSRGEISQGVIVTPTTVAKMPETHGVFLRINDRRQVGEWHSVNFKRYMGLWRNYTALLIHKLHDKDILVGNRIVGDARLLESHNGTHGANQLLMNHSSLLLDFPKRLLSGFGGTPSRTPLLARVIDSATNKQQSQDRYKDSSPMGLGVGEKSRLLVCASLWLISLLSGFCGFWLVYSADIIEDVSIVNLAKVACGVLLILAFWIGFHAALSILDFGKICWDNLFL